VALNEHLTEVAVLVAVAKPKVKAYFAWMKREAEKEETAKSTITY